MDENGKIVLFEMGRIPIHVVATAGPYHYNDDDDLINQYHLIIKINLNCRQKPTAELMVKYDIFLLLTNMQCFMGTLNVFSWN